VRFVVDCHDPIGQDRLEHMGYLAIGPDRFATRWFPAEAGASRHFGRFAASLEAMVLQSARLVPVPWGDALEAFLARAAGTPLRWWLYGSAARGLRGEPADPGDIDVHVDDALVAGRIFDDLLVTPVERMEGWVAPWTGRAFDHAIIEWIADPPFRPPTLEVVRWRGYEVPVVAGG
jgi:hypothetical protein